MVNRDVQRGEFLPGTHASWEEFLPPARATLGARPTRVTSSAHLKELGEFLKARQAEARPVPGPAAGCWTI